MTMPENARLRTASEIEQERLAFKADRYGHNGNGSPDSHLGRITYLCHTQGYVMARRPGAMPFVISERLWRSFRPWKEVDAEIVGKSK